MRPLGIRGGFTMVETLVAIVLLAVGTLALAGLMSGAGGLTGLAHGRVELTTLAEGKLEALRLAAAFHTPDTVQLALGGSLTAPLSGYADTVFDARGQRHARFWFVRAAPAGTRSVTVRVRSLQPGRLAGKQLDLTSLVLP